MSSFGLSKSRFVAGLQCTRQLWWKVHEPDAPELAMDPGVQIVLDRGQVVGDLARTHVPGGVLIDVPYHEYDSRVEATARALANGAPAVYEASFMADDVFVSVDILQRRGKGFALIEVKSSLDVKDYHYTDVAIQTHVARRAGVPVVRAEVMHLNRECRHPDLSNLFVRRSVTRQIRPLLRAASDNVRRLHAMLAGPIPDVNPGAHCTRPHECPFMDRCWPALPEHHVSTLYTIGRKGAEKLMATGYETIADLPRDFEATGPRKRQILSIQSGAPFVGRGLGRALARLKPPIAYLDFETVGLAVPAWPGCWPYQGVPVEFSCHRTGASGATTHDAWLADGPGDPRRALAEALLKACEGASTVVAYNASFEAKCIAELAAVLPDLAKGLRRINARLRDLLAIVRDHVYHPDFGGRFGLKSVLPALVPGMGYDDLAIQDGMAASAALEAMMFARDAMTKEKREKLRRDLMKYCERDTLAMVRLHRKLEGMRRISSTR